MTDLQIFTIAFFLSWFFAATAIVWRDIQPRTGEQLLGVLVAGMMCAPLLAAYAWVVVWYSVRWVLRAGEQ